MSEKAAAVGKVARSYFEAVAARDVEAMMSCWQLPGVGHIHGVAELLAPEGYREWFGSLFRAFPAFRFEVLEVIADEERRCAGVRLAPSTARDDSRGWTQTGTASISRGATWSRSVTARSSP
jgi:predicted ester cyclase